VPAAEVGSVWSPPRALAAASLTPASTYPPTAPPGDHDVSPG
jgi:hypothetical protein